MKRSKEIITKSDLKKLLRLASIDINSFFDRNPKYKEHQGEETLVALCQGAALHYIDKTNGVKDFDVWFFYPSKNITLPYRRRGVVDFGVSNFGKHPNVKEYLGRTVDVLMRSDSYFKCKNPQKAMVNYLVLKKSETSYSLSQKAVIGLHPKSVFGKVIWPQKL